MTSDGSLQKRFLVGALVCFCLLIVFHIGLIGTTWGHQLDADAYLGRGAFSRKVMIMDAVLLTRVTSATVIGLGGLWWPMTRDWEKTSSLALIQVAMPLSGPRLF
jgi:hypothetical protein